MLVLAGAGLWIIQPADFIGVTAIAS